MQTPVSLNKSNPLLPAEDYNALRKQGIKYIEMLSSDIWTDYNFSDPGITILEAVCYAITDLGYRNGFALGDLLAPEHLADDTWKEIFYTARQILHNNPLTITDYRKLLLDIRGVRNAWIEPAKEYEVPLWMDYNAVSVKEHHCSCEGDTPELCYGQLGVTAVTADQVQANRTKEKADFDQQITKIDTDVARLQQRITDLNVALSNQDIDPTTRAELEQKKAAAQKEVDTLTAMKAVLQRAETYLTTTIAPPKIVELEGLYKVMIEYEEDILAEDLRENIRTQAMDRLLRHRNLCEDFLSVDAVEYQDEGLLAAIELEEYADPDEVVAQLFFTVYKYFSPSIPFYTIGQMLDKGFQVDEIFEGPALKHGFMVDADVENTDLFRDIRLSDIINEVSEISGVKAITYLHIPADENSGNDHHGQFFADWVEALGRERRIARIKPDMSKVLCCKQRDLITYNMGQASDRRPARMLKIFEDLKKLERKYKLEGQQVDFPVPAGEYMELENYYPVTYSLPMCYGVSDRAGLPGNATEKQKIQALQLRGYLMFFEQLLKGHLVQLNHLRDLFRFDNIVKHTYFTKPLPAEEYQNLADLLVNFGNHPADHKDDIIKDFAGALQGITESPETFLQRRNTFLNHMLARFSEDLTEYETLTRWLTPAHVEEKLISDKIRMLQNGEYLHISSERGKGYNYADQVIWDTPNVSGAERRVSRLLGFANASRRSLTPDNITSEPVMVPDEKTKVPEWKVNKRGQHVNVVKFVDTEHNNTVLLTSVEVADGCCTDALMSDILANADIRLHYRFHDDLKQRSRKTAGQLGSFWFELYDGPDPGTAVLLATGERFESKNLREAAFKKIQQLIARINANEGLHLVEHLLLRPRIDVMYSDGDPATQIQPSLLNTCLSRCDVNIGAGEMTGQPVYWKKITRIPAEKCYDKMPWILEYYRLRKNKTSGKDEPVSVLFQETFLDEKQSPHMLKFRLYSNMTQRILDLQEFGSERINYQIVSNGKDESTGVKYKFVIHGNKGIVLAQSAYLYNQKTQLQQQQGTTIDDDIEDEIAGLMTFFGYEMDWYCKANPCDNDEDPYSFRTTVVLPCWPKRFRDLTFRNFVEKTIQTEFPAYVQTKIVWVGINEMSKFEQAYKDWLLEMAQTELPGYEKTNPLVDAINNIQACGSCDDNCD